MNDGPPPIIEPNWFWMLVLTGVFVYLCWIVLREREKARKAFWKALTEDPATAPPEVSHIPTDP